VVSCSQTKYRPQYLHNPSKRTLVLPDPEALMKSLNRVQKQQRPIECTHPTPATWNKFVTAGDSVKSPRPWRSKEGDPSPRVGISRPPEDDHMGRSFWPEAQASTIVRTSRSCFTSSSAVSVHLKPSGLMLGGARRTFHCRKLMEPTANIPEYKMSRTS
jgi:hypothetical protein